jgi:hypothetical protein
MAASDDGSDLEYATEWGHCVDVTGWHLIESVSAIDCEEDI